MAGPVQLEIQGLEELRAAFKEWPKQIARAMQAAMKGATEMVRGGVAKYPPATIANRPPGPKGYSWYERGFGTRTVTGKAYQTSETLGKSWTTEVRGFAAGVRGIVGAKASYAPFVQDEDRQARFHKERGWLTVQDVLKRKTEAIVRLFEIAIAKVLRR